MTSQGRIDVAPADWEQVVSGLQREGFVLFDFITAVDRGARLEVVARVINPATRVPVMVWTTLPADAAELSSLSGIYLGATWCEREAAEMFGVRFIGLGDSRPLLLRASLGEPPMRKSSALVARAIRDWPGAAQSTDDGRQGANPSRRRQLPPGVPEGFLRDDPLASDSSGDDR